MHEQKIKSTLLMDADLSQASSKLNQLQNILKSLKLPVNLEKQFNNLFSNATNNLEKYQQKLNSGFKTKGDLTSLEKTGNALKNSIVQIEKEWGKLQAMDLSQIVRLDSSTEAKIKQLENRFKSLGVELQNKVQPNLTKITEEINKLTTASSKKAGNNISELLETGQFEQASKELDNYIAKQDKVLKSIGKKVTNDKGEKVYDTSDARTASLQRTLTIYQSIKTELNSVLGLSSQYNQAIQNLNTERMQIMANAVQNANAKLEQGATILKQTSTAANTYTQTMQQSAQRTAELGNDLDTLKNRVRHFFSLTNSVMLFRQILRSTIETTKELDAAMTETAVVTDFSVADMWKDLPRYTNIAKELGTTIKGVYETMTLYYQQGLKTEEVVEVGTETLKMARIAGLDYAKATDFMTAALRGFNMEVNEINAQKVNDVYSELAAITAADTKEIATAMTKTASIASSANMEFETTAAFLSQIIETTRESAETAGTALKTVIARFTELKKDPSEIGEVDGEIVDANKIETALRTIGVALRDASGQFRELDDVFLDIASKWDNLDTNTQRYIATMAAGSRQQSRFIAMMSDYGRTVELVNAANNSAGASQKQFDKTLESLESKLNKLKDAWDQFTMGIANNTLIKGGIDALTGLLNIVNKLTKGLPGVTKSIGNLLLMIGGFSAGGKVFRAFSASVLADFQALSKGAIKAGEHVGDSFFGALKKEFHGKNKFTEIFKNPLSEMTKTADKMLLENQDLFNLLTKTDSSEEKDIISKKILENAKVRANLTQQIVDTEKNYNSLQELGYGKLTSNLMINRGISVEKAKQYAIERASNKEDDEEIKKLQKRILLEQLLTGGLSSEELKTKLENYSKEATGLKKVTTGKIANWAASKLATEGIKGLVVAFIKVGAVAALIAGAIVVLNHLIETNAEKQERLNNAIDHTSNSMQEARSAIDEAKNSMEELSNLESEFDDLVAGTDAWKEKLVEVNNKVIELLEKFPKLAQYLSQDSSGRLSFSSEGWDAVLKEQQKKLNASSLANLTAINQKNVIDTNEAIIQKAKQDLEFGNYDLGIFADIENIRKEIYEKANSGTWFDSSSIKQNTLVSTTTDTQGRPIASTQEIYEKYSNEEITILNELVGKISANNLQAQKSAEAIASQFVKQYNEVEGTKYEQGLSKIIGSKISITQDGKLSQELLNTLNDNYGWFTSDGKANYLDKDVIWQEYADREGLTYKEVKEKYRTSNDITSLALELASEKTAEKLSDSAGLIIKGLRKIGLETLDISDSWSEAFESLFTTGLTETDISALKTESVTFEELPTEIQKYFNNDETQYSDFIKEQIATASEQLASAKSTLETLNITELDTSKLSAGALKGLADKLNQVYYKSGEEGVNAITDSFNTITKNLNREELEKFTSALDGIDWSSTLSIEDFKNILYDLGIYVDDVDLENLTDDIIKFGKASKAVDLQQLTAQLEKSQDLIKDLEKRERGDRTFSKEQMDQFVSSGIDSNLFVGYGDSFQYVGTSLDALTEAVKDNTIATLKDTQDKLKEQIETAKIATKYDTLNSGKLGDYGILTEKDRQNLLADILKNTTSDEIAGYSKDSLSVLTKEPLEMSQQQTLNEVLKTLADSINKEDYFQSQLEANQRSLGFLEYSNKSLDETANVAINGETEIDRTNATNALLEQASHYAELTDEIRAYHEAMEGANEEDKKTAKQQLATGIAIEKRAKELDELDDKVEDHIEGLKKTKKGTEAYEESLSDLTEDMNDAFGTDLTSEFFNPEQTQNLKLLEQAIKGSQSAWNQLIQNMMIATFKSEEFSTKYGLMSDHVTNVTNALNGLSFNINGTADVTQLVASLFAAEKTGEEVAQFLEDLSLTNIQLEVDNNIKGIENLADIENWDDVAGGIKISATNVNIPAARRSSSFGSGGRNSGSKGGGGGGSSEKWENPYDSFYNITEDINELLDKRNQLEKEYDLLLQNENASIDDYLDSYKNRLASYQEEIGLQEQALKMRQQEQEHLLSKNSKLQKYAWVEDGEVKINFKEIDKVQDQELGEDIEEYISALEENDEAIQEAQDAIQENTLAIEDLMDEWRDTAANFEERVYDALVWEREQQIKEMEEISSALEESNSNLIDAIQEEIDERRRERENEETEKDLSEKQRRLAYLQQDTSGAYEQEILQLQKEITEGQEDYTDTLIDQKIDELEKQNDEAKKQREKQIKLAEYQLENDKERGAIAQQTRDILEDANSSAGWSRVWKLLERSEGFRSLTDTNKKVWTEDTQKEFKETMAYLNGTKGSGTIKQDLKNSNNNNNNSGYTPPADRGDQSSSSGGNQSSSGGIQSSSGGDQSSSGGNKKPVESKRSKYSDAVWLGGYDRYYNVGGNWYHTNQVEDINVKDKTLIIKKNQKGTFSPVTSVGTLNFDIKLTEATYGNAEKAMEAFKKSSKSFIYNKIRYYEISEGRYVPLSSIKQSNGSKLHPSDSYVYVPKGTRTYKKYKTGGLADFTGPAWLDGTKSKPELVLNQKDTQNFLQLKDVLGSFMKNRNSVTTNTTNGDTIYEIDINVEKISNDYDVEQLAKKIKQMIGSDAAYRNSNIINHLR